MIHKKINLYEGKEHPYMDTYILNRICDGAGTVYDKPRGAVVIVPGGGYAITSEREAEPIAMKFAAAGYHTFVVWYRTKPEKHTDPLEDLARAVATVRAHAQEWHLNPDDITTCGFSAGAHLAAMLGVFWDKPFLAELVGMDRECFRPNKQILCYPVISSGKFAHVGSFENLTGGDVSLYESLSLEKQVGENTPQTFLWHTAEDAAVPVENSLLFAAALSEYKIPFELHIFPKGPHGLSVAEECTSGGNPDLISPVCAQWVSLAAQWLKR